MKAIRTVRIEGSEIVIGGEEEEEKRKDPLSWYGILVPPSLRQTQQTFITATEDVVMQLATVVGEMQTVEREIRQKRG